VGTGLPFLSWGMPDVIESSDRTLSAPSHHFAWGVVATAVFTVLLTPVTFGAAFFALLVGGRSDTRGRGGPFRSCTADSTMCSDPNVLAVSVCALVILVCCIASGFMGMGVSGAGAKPAHRPTENARRTHPMARAGWMLSGLSVVFTTIATPALGSALFFL
jgi:hypothetical protein